MISAKNPSYSLPYASPPLKNELNTASNSLDLSECDITSFANAVLSGMVNLVDRGILPGPLPQGLVLFNAVASIKSNVGECEDLFKKMKITSPYMPITAVILGIFKYEAIRRVYSYPKLAPAFFIMSALGTCVVGARALAYLKKSREVGTKEDWQKILINTFVHAVNVSHSAYQTSSIYSFIMKSELEKRSLLLEELQKQYDKGHLKKNELSCRVLDLECTHSIPLEKPLKENYKKYSMLFHPDKAPSPLKESAEKSFKVVTEARDYLKNKMKAKNELTVLDNAIKEMYNSEELVRLDRGLYIDSKEPGFRSVKGACQVLRPLCGEVDDFWKQVVEDKGSLGPVLKEIGQAVNQKVAQVAGFFNNGLDSEDNSRNRIDPILNAAASVINQLIKFRKFELSKNIVSPCFISVKE